MRRRGDAYADLSVLMYTRYKLTRRIRSRNVEKTEPDRDEIPWIAPSPFAERRTGYIHTMSNQF